MAEQGYGERANVPYFLRAKKNSKLRRSIIANALKKLMSRGINA